MIEAVRAFLHLFEDTTPDEARRPERLCAALDRLLIAYHESADVAPLTDDMPPRRQSAATRAMVATCFPELGPYGWSAPEDRPGNEIMIGDALDDLADIYDDLQGVVWLCENSGPEDSTWEIRHSYRSHWGRHLLNLRSYLHWILYER